MRLSVLLCVLCVSVVSFPAVFAQETRVPDAAQFVGRPNGTALTGERLDRETLEVSALLRCPVCQGLSVADSPSVMATNMKHQVRELLSRGYTREQILTYFERSYGEFVLLRPKFGGLNTVVWVLPLFLLLLGAGIVLAKMKRGVAPAAEAGATWICRNDPPDTTSAAIGVWLACAAFFSLLIAGPANPFLTVPIPPLDGPGPNALLQNHILMIIHPPMLYLGYVGMTIPFGLATAALLRGRLGHSLLSRLRDSLLLPWVFLTVAIMLGGWWAYEVLGWGGYWAWDPVENASLLPWLTATAALHSAIVLERRGVLKGWTVTLVQASFLLTILGTFMTRSGVFNSVHSFTQSEIGPTILVFLAAALLFSIVLLALRIDRLGSEGKVDGALSRDGAFLVNNLLFVLLTFTVLTGTIFPLIVEAVQGRQMSVGRPYFDSMVVPIGAALLFLLGVGPALPWGRSTPREALRALLPPLGGAAVLLAAGLLLGLRNGWTLLTLAFGGYAAQVTMGEMWLPLVERVRRGEPFRSAFVHGQLRRGRRRFGSYLVHAGAVIVIIAIAVSSTMKRSSELVMEKGQSARFGSYAITFTGAEARNEPHRFSTIARFAITRDGLPVTTLSPRMNQYASMREPIGTPDVYTTLSGDLYLSIMNVDVGAQRVGVQIIATPLVVWIWISVFLMGFGGLVALFPQRRPIIALNSSVAETGEALAPAHGDRHS